ncbi:hypothetical protein [Campylobacter sp.]|uniref:hypothetical protein n=1 Tax=Campylobacter sp. TaxID=205 RepID=UPI0026DCBEA6|nr:hypothetical protein [Campylobacter sp.]MDO4673578.1 hypothetical protein [Campylobacter sp.]
MRIRLFIVASLIYGALVAAACVFYLDLGDYQLVLGAIDVKLPVVVWMLAPLALYFVFALLHLSFYSFLNHLKFKHFFKDAKKFEDFTKDLLLEKNPKIAFQTKEFKQVGELSRSLRTQQKLPDHPKINEIFDLLDGLRRGEVLNLGKFKLEAKNILSIQNEKNRIKNDVNHAHARLKNVHQINDDLEDLAFENVLEKGTYEQIKSIKIAKNPQQILSLIARFQRGDLELSLSEFEVLILQTRFNEAEYLSLAKMSVNFFTPDAILNIFLKIKSQNNEALKGYLYLLAEFSMYEELENQIRNADEDFTPFKALLLLREKNIKIKPDHLIQ